MSSTPPPQLPPPSSTASSAPTSPKRNVTAQAAPQPSRGWTSILSGAVTSLESKLDIILADDDQASARARAAEEATRRAKAADKIVNAKSQSHMVYQSQTPQPDSNGGSRPASRNDSTRTGRASDRLQARLARAVQGGARATVSSRDSSVSAKDVRQSVDEKREVASPTVASETSAGAESHGVNDKDGDNEAVQPSLEDAATIIMSEPEELSPEEAEVARLKAEHSAEVHEHLEKIDALHAKVAYLSGQKLADANAEAETSGDGSAERKSAEQDAKIAQLLQEGEKLSRNEMKHLAAIKKLRSRVQDEEKSSTSMKKRLEKAETEARDLREALRATEIREKAAEERCLGFVEVSRQLESTRLEKQDAIREIQDLQRQLDEAEKRTDEAVKKAQTEKVEEQKRAIADLEDELSNSRIEKRLVEDRVKKEMSDIKEEYGLQLDKARLTELELKGEVQNLEAKLEVLILKSEEASASSGTDAQAKLLRQIETLQTQYALASENWQGIEGSLNARVTTLEKERDDLAKRESDIRKRAREVNSKARRFEEDLENVNEQNTSMTSELEQLRELITKLESKLHVAEKTSKDAREALESERRSVDTMVLNRVEEEKAKWKTEVAIMNNSGPSTPLDAPQAFLRADQVGQRKSSATSDLMGFGGSGSLRRSSGRPPHLGDLGLLFPDNNSRPGSRRSGPGQYPVRTPTDPSFAARLYDLGRSASPPVPQVSHMGTANGGTPPMISSTAPSIHNIDSDVIPPMSRRDTGPDETESRRSSPQRTVAELISGSHGGGAGPSVQLVERMSASVRRLEMEKAAAREEMLRMQVQRDGARDEVVSLMREVDAITQMKSKEEALLKEMEGLNQRYEAALEMLGEKSEECEELRNDVLDLKKIYRELVESTIK